MVWKRLHKLVKGQEPPQNDGVVVESFVPPPTVSLTSSPVPVLMYNKPSSSLSASSRLAPLSDDEFNDMNEPDWLASPRDLTVLQGIIDATASPNATLSEFAFLEMVKIIERTNSTEEENHELLKKAFDAALQWASRTWPRKNCGPVLDSLPNLLEIAYQVTGFEQYVTKLNDYLKQCLDVDDECRRQAIVAVGVLLERRLLAEEELKETILPLLYQLTEPLQYDVDNEEKVEIVTVLCRIVACEAIADHKWLFDNFVWRYANFLMHPVVHVRKTALSIVGNIARLFGEKFTELFIVPHVIALADDTNWGIRKAVCENFVQVSKCCPRSTRQKILAPQFVKLLHDHSRWVCYAAFQELGPFISTFANSSVTGLTIHEGKLKQCPEQMDTSTTSCQPNPEVSTKPPADEPRAPSEFDHIPLNVLTTNDEALSLDFYGQEVMDELQSALDEYMSNKNKPTRSAPPSVMGDEPSTSSPNRKANTSEVAPTPNVSSQCTSMEDLTCIGAYEMDDSYEDEDGDHLNTTQQDYKMSDNNEPEDMDIQNDTLEAGVEETKETEEEDFNSHMYWSNTIAFDIEEDLVAFGTGPSPPADSDFLHRRFDVLSVKDDEMERKIIEPSSPSTSQRSRTSSKNDNIDDDEFLHDVRGQDEDEDMKDDTTSSVDSEQQDQHQEDHRHVPQELVDSFMSMVSPGGGTESDINRYCAHNFPAVAYTLGRNSWPQLRETYHKLASDDQLKVRTTIASSLHEIAAIMGDTITDNDLVPVFNSLRNDVPEVRVGILKHLFQFVKCLTIETRRGMIDILPQFMPLDSSLLSSNWRYRLEFASQCKKLCELYGVEEINHTMSAIALTLANDRVAEVRKEAVELVSIILGRLVAYEWPTLESSTQTEDDAKSLVPLSELFVKDIVGGFARTQKWTRRQTFVHICEQVLVNKTMTHEQFRYFFLPHLSAMASDRVANVRIGVCRVLGHLEPCLKPQPLRLDRTECTQTVGEVLERLTKDDDMDVSREARLATVIVTRDKETINLDGRDVRLSRRENELISSRVGATMMDDHTEMDMCLSPS